MLRTVWARAEQMQQTSPKSKSRAVHTLEVTLQFHALAPSQNSNLSSVGQVPASPGPNLPTSVYFLHPTSNDFESSFFWLPYIKLKRFRRTWAVKCWPRVDRDCRSPMTPQSPWLRHVTERTWTMRKHEICCNLLVVVFQISPHASQRFSEARAWPQSVDCMRSPSLAPCPGGQRPSENKITKFGTPSQALLSSPLGWGVFAGLAARGALQP